MNDVTFFRNFITYFGLRDVKFVSVIIHILKILKMRKLIFSVLSVFVLIFVFQTQLKAETETAPATIVATAPVASADIGVLIARVETIKAMDISTLSSSERKELRKELRTIKSDLKKHGKNNLNSINSNGGVYLSVGAIIIIVLLLILLL